MAPLIFTLDAVSLFMLNPCSLLEPQIGDIVIRRLTPNSMIQYYLYKAPEPWSQYHKTWLIKIFSASASSLDVRIQGSGCIRSVKCMMLMVWEYGLGFKESLTGGILILETPESGTVVTPSLGQGRTCPDLNTIVLAFTQPSLPRGPTFLRADFWKEKYLDDDYVNLMVFSVVDSQSGTGLSTRTLTRWSRVGMTWTFNDSITGASTIYTGLSLVKLSA